MPENHDAIRLQMSFSETSRQFLKLISPLLEKSVGGIEKDQIDRSFGMN